MRVRVMTALIRVAPVVLVTLAAGLWIHDVESGGPYVWRNLLPPFFLVLLTVYTLWRGEGRWIGAGWRWPMATLGFAIPALGLTLYLHYAFAVNLDGMFGAERNPGQLFRYLPIYTFSAGAIGFAIGWIVGRGIQ